MRPQRTPSVCNEPGPASRCKADPPLRFNERSRILKREQEIRVLVICQNARTGNTLSLLAFPKV